jgi:hypothetical protein
MYYNSGVVVNSEVIKLAPDSIPEITSNSYNGKCSLGRYKTCLSYVCTYILKRQCS